MIISKLPVRKVTWIITGINLRDVLAKTNGASHARARDGPKEAIKREISTKLRRAGDKMKHLGGWEELLQLSFLLEEWELVVGGVAQARLEHYGIQIWESTTKCVSTA